MCTVSGGTVTVPHTSFSTPSSAHLNSLICRASHSALNAFVGSCGMDMAAPDIWSCIPRVWSAALSCPRIRLYMLLNPNTFKKYHDAELTQDASNEFSSIPRCNIGLKRNVNGNGTLVVRKPEKAQLIQPPMTIMGKTLVRFPFIMSVIMEGSVIGFFATTSRSLFLVKNPVFSLLKKSFLIWNDFLGMNRPFSRRCLLLISAWLSDICWRSTFFSDESNIVT